MSESVDALVLDLLEWIGDSPRPCDEVLDAWRTSCPRLPVWEEANDRGLLDRRRTPAGPEVISVSEAGRRYLREHRPVPVPSGRP
jgi:D-3-phosphoglycerate dehydrogenase